MLEFEGKNVLINECNKKLNIEISDINQVSWGGNNRLYYIRSSDNKEFFAKFYYNDKRKRLYNEFTSYDFLRRKGFTDVPIPYLKNDELNFGVYSYEKGRVKNNEELTTKDIDIIVDFFIKLESIDQKQVDVVFDYIPVAHITPDQYLTNVRNKLNKFKVYIELQEASKKAVEFFGKNQVEKTITSFADILTSKLQIYSKDAMEQSKYISLGVTDFGADNLIIKEDGSHCFIDFEDFGWNNPLATVADFVNHIKRKNMPKHLKEYFILQYKNRSLLSQNFKSMLDLILTLDLLEWLSTFLFWITPEKVNVRKFANPNFDEEAYIQEKIDAFFIYKTSL